MRAWFQKHQNKIGAVVAVAIAFLAGFQIGKITSPYYAAHPIIFQDAPAVSPEALNNLLEASAATPTPKATLTPPANAATSKFVASKNSNLYHDPTCPSASRIKPENQVWFASREEAEAAGFSPSVCTKEKLGL